MRLRPEQAGISLVELLVSMAIALLVLAGVVQTFLVSKQSYLYNEQLAFIQENARFAVERVTRDVRQAGYVFTGDCPPPQQVSLGIADTTLEGNAGFSSGSTSFVGVYGYESGGNFPASIANDIWPGSDVLSVWQGARSTMVAHVADHTSGRFNLKAGATHEFQPGTIWTAISKDCTHIAIVTQSGPSNADGDATYIQHATSSGTETYNCTTTINIQTGKRCYCYPAGHPSEGNPSPGCSDTVSVDPFEDDALIAAGVGGSGSKIFYLAPSSVDADVPALYQRSGGRSEELVMGIDDFQVEYGLPQGGNQMRYVTANQITNVEDWAQINMVRVQLVFRSQAEVLPEVEQREFLGVSYNDRYLRQVISSTIQIRNAFP